MQTLSILPQLLINGIIAGSIYALAAFGFSLVYHVAKFQYFTQGAIITLSAYIFSMFFSEMGIGIFVSVPLTILCAVGIALIVNRLIYEPLSKRKATPTIKMISSIVILIFCSSLMIAIFGAGTKSIDLEGYSSTIPFGESTITTLQIVIIFSGLAVFALLYFLLKKTKTGRAMRAISDNKDVAQIVGINPKKIYRITIAVSAVIAAVAGILIGMEQNIYPRMGVLIIIKGFISAVVGGLGNITASFVGGIFIGLAENLGILYIPSYFKDIISFGILLLFLLFRPQGIFGVRLRDDS